METPRETQSERAESPDPSSHAANAYDAAATGNDWVDDGDDDDMDFEPTTTDESEDIEFFDPAEEEDTEFHGMCEDRQPEICILQNSQVALIEYES